MALAERAELLGLDFERSRMPAVVDRCLEWCRQARRRSHIVITANASHLCMMRHDAVLREACQAGDMSVADGMSVVWALRALGRPVPERVAGIDLMTNLLAAGGREQMRVYFLGAKQEVIDALVRICAERYPGLVIAGTRNGYFKAAESEAIVNEIRACEPHMLFVGMPSPFKETWCQRHRDRLNVPLIIGVGGSFDVIAEGISGLPPDIRDSIARGVNRELERALGRVADESDRTTRALGRSAELADSRKLREDLNRRALTDALRR